MTSFRTRPSALTPYKEAGYQLIPLKSGSKAPRDKNWTNKSYDSFNAVRHMEAGNVGVRLTAEDLVIDVDPRNDTTEEGAPSAYVEFIRAFGLNPDELPTVITGSGGYHHYLKKPADVAVVDSLKQYPGVEFKTRGRQVVAAGSVHPQTGKQYAWDELTPAVTKQVLAPADLLDAIARTTTSGTVTEAGTHSPEELKTMLAALEPENYSNHQEWFELMQACHHATGGQGRQEFIEWSTGDLQYVDAGEEIGKRWDSLHADRVDGITYKTLHKALRDADREDLIPRSSPAEDFDDEPNVPSEALVGEPVGGGNPITLLVEEMNEQFCAVLDGGGFSVFMQDQDPAFGRPFWTRLSREGFRHYYEDERIAVVGDRNERTKADIWLSHPKRRKYRGIVMDPQNLPENEGKLNLWQGWSVHPAQGDWSLMRELIEEVLCDGDAEATDYVLRWIAFMLQRPWEAPETAIAFRGSEGTGKGTLGRVLMRIAGTHGLTVSSPAQLAGRFNSHLRDCVFLFADEAVWPGDKSAEGTLKQLITEPVISYEAKGKDLVAGKNMIHVMMASNEEWVVPAGRTARRFFVQDVSDRRQGDRSFFGRLWQQMDRGGLAGMVCDLLAMDLADWHPSRSIPQTQALADQKIMSAGPIEKFWLEILSQEQPPVVILDDEIDWSQQPIILGAIERAELNTQLKDFLIRQRIFPARATHKALLKVGKPLGVVTTRKGGGAERAWVLPPLPEMRAAFEKMVGATGLFD